MYSDVVKHPLGSLLAEDYVGSASHVKKLLGHFSPGDQIRLQYLLDSKAITVEELTQYANEMKERPSNVIKAIDEKLRLVICDETQ